MFNGMTCKLVNILVTVMFDKFITFYNCQLSKLNGNNYHHRSIQMRVLYKSLELWSIVVEELREPTGDIE